MTGPAIVCLHGLGRTAADWAPATEALATLGPVAAPQLPPHPTAAIELLDAAISPDDVVIAHSMGGALLMRLLARRPRPLRAVVLTGSFFPPARNGRSLAASIRDYGVHRVAFLRQSRFEPGSSVGRSAIAPLASLVRQAASTSEHERALDRASGAVLVIHARDDHHVPIDFAMAATRRHPGWRLRVLDGGGHHAHVGDADSWSRVVVPLVRQHCQT